MQLKRSQTMKRASEFAMVRSKGKSEAGRFLILSTATLPEGEEDVCGRYEIRVGTTYPRTLARCKVNCQVFRRDAFTVEAEDVTEKVAPEEFVLKEVICH